MPVIMVASPKGGVGKTTLAANIAFEISRSGNRVLALDTDPQNALRLHFGLPFQDKSGLIPALQTYGRWQPAVRETSHGVLVLPYGEGAISDGVDAISAAAAAGAAAGPAANAIARVLQDILSDVTMTVVVDTPPGPSEVLSAVLPLTDVLITALLADAASAALIPLVEQGRFYRPAVGAARRSRHGYVLNQLNPVSRLSPAVGEAVRHHVRDRLIGTVTRDELVAEAVANQKPVASFAPASRAAQDIALIAKSLIGHLRGLPA